MLWKVVLSCVSVAIAAGCGSGSSADKAIEREIEQGLAAIESVHDRRALQAKLTAIVAKLRGEEPDSKSARSARALAIAGFEAKTASVGAEREFYENDSGQVAEATKDAASADALRARAEDLLRAAERALHG